MEASRNLSCASVCQRHRCAAMLFLALRAPGVRQREHVCAIPCMGTRVIGGSRFDDFIYVYHIILWLLGGLIFLRWRTTFYYALFPDGNEKSAPCRSFIA